MNNNLKKILNFISFNPSDANLKSVNTSKNSMANRITPLQLQRIRQSTQTWRDAADEAERAYLPFRVKQQQLYIDTILNSQIRACMDRRKDLTLLRDFQISDSNGNIDEKTTLLIKEKWFNDFLNYTLDALFFGYSYISLGDIENGKFTDITIIKRQNISPDRQHVSVIPYNPIGISFDDEQYVDWHVFVGTNSETGLSSCGYGLLYAVGVYEIFLRNILGYNGDFVELYSQPFRVGKTNKTEEAERNLFEKAVAEMGSSGYAILDVLGDSIEFMETARGGNGWQGYDNFEQRLEKKISKIILGHADALDSVSGKLGAGQGDDNPTAQALEDKQTRDGMFVENVINTELLPRMERLGFTIPLGCKFEFKNNSEKQENIDKFVAQAVLIKQAGLQVDKDYFEKETGIMLSEPILPPPPIVNPIAEKKEVPPIEKIKNRIDELYNLK